MRALSATIEAAVVGALTLLAAPLAAAETSVDCIPVPALRRTTAIDHQTIIATLRNRGEFRRIALATPCGGLKFHDGFAFDTPDNRLCRGTSITVIKTGSVCAIAAIDRLTADEAETLLTDRATARAADR